MTYKSISHTIRDFMEGKEQPEIVDLHDDPYAPEEDPKKPSPADDVVARYLNRKRQIQSKIIDNA